MGNKPPQAPPKTPKELKREMNRSIDRMIREFNRDKFRIQMDLKKLEKELEKMIKNKDAKQSQKMMAQNILRQKAFIQKYDMMEAKMKGVKVQLAQISSTTAMVEIMQKMGTLLNKSNQDININNIQQVIEQFNMGLEQQENMGEMISDAMDQDEDEIEDNDVDQYLNDMTDKLGGGGQGGQKQKVTEQTTDFDAMIDDLKR